ncbi:MAG: YajQ family cyclic di-GMP-binding protein [Thermaerobacter sp.]|nr:YajQ family cyclic di-GMP-binding protein [Thermaerobacter sp.]
MAKESSFDVVSEPDLAELINALDQTRRETATRYDFRGHDIVIEWDAAQYKIRLDSPAGMVLDSLQNVLGERMARRGVSLRFLEFGEPEPHGMDRATVVVTVKKGIETSQAKNLQKAIRAMGLKVDAQIQGDAIRVSGKSKDDLQAVMQGLRAQDFGIDLAFVNLR